MIRKFLPRLATYFVERPKPLGRWSLNSEQDNDIKGTLANLDSCGDALCGDPRASTNAINAILAQSQTVHPKDQQYPQDDTQYYFIDGTVFFVPNRTNKHVSKNIN